MYQILLVDSDEKYRKYFNRLEIFYNNKSNFQIFAETSNAYQALEILKRNKIDVVISEWNLPTISGRELLRIICDESLCDYFIFLTAESNYKSIRTGFFYGAFDYLIKPLDIELLYNDLNIVENNLQKKKTIDLDFQEYVTKFMEILCSEDNNLCGQIKQWCKSIEDFLSKKSTDNYFFIQEQLETLKRELTNEINNNYGYKVVDKMYLCIDQHKQNQNTNISLLWNTFQIEIEQMTKWLMFYFPKTMRKTFIPICSYIWDNFNMCLSLPEIAKKFYLNSSYLSTRFTKEVHMTYRTYINNVRIEMSKKILRNSNYKIQEIAYQVGYKDEEYFRRIFKKITGISPSQYREKSKSVT